MRTGIIDSLGRFRERDVAAFDPIRTPRGCVAERRTEVKNSRGHFVVALDLARASAPFRIDESQAPAEPVFSERDRNRIPPHFPIAGCARPLKGAEQSGLRVPSWGHDHKALLRVAKWVRRRGYRDVAEKK
jgi:hypothetical protein